MLPSPDEMFSQFLGLMPKQVCLYCLTAIYGMTDAGTVRARLGELGDAVETVEASCSNCDCQTTTYRMRHH